MISKEIIKFSSFEDLKQCVFDLLKSKKHYEWIVPIDVDGWTIIEYKEDEAIKMKSALRELDIDIDIDIE